MPLPVYLIFLLFLQVNCFTLINENLINNELIPTLGSEFSLCRNHSKFYLEELKKMTLWATEMYDSSGKFPSGILYGSGYALGRYDECVDIEVPNGTTPFTGKYCMAKIIITPNYKYKMNKTVDFEFGNYRNYYNISAWSKMLAYTTMSSAAPRNEIYYSLCLPSSCSENDLKNSLNVISEKFNQESTDFLIKIQTDKQTCQVKSKYDISRGDLLFISFILFSVVFVICASLYDVIYRNENSLLQNTPGQLRDIIFCFSLPRNLKKLSSSSTNEHGLDFLAGIKVISMFLIIMGHRCMFTYGAPLFNPIFLERMYSKLEVTPMLNGPIIVDTFFMISGFLATYFSLNALNKSKGFNIILIYIHRLIRMTPAYAVVLAFYCTIFASLGDGPFWEERVGVEKERCLQSWWANMLYINNYVNTDRLCMFQSWYITCDIHYFLLIPPLVMLLKKKPVWGVPVILAIIFCSILIVLITVYINQEHAILLLYMRLLKDPVSNSTFKNIYIPSHMRASPYFVGVITGYIKYRMNNSSYKLPKWFYSTGWILAVIFGLGTLYLGFIFYLPHISENPIISAVYSGFHHFTFSAGIAWFIIAISAGKGAWIEPILTIKPFIVLSRISYTTFLCHGAIQLYTAAIMRQPNHIGVFSGVYLTFGDITISYIFGFLLSMVFEAPIIGLEKIIFGKNKLKTP